MDVSKFDAKYENWKNKLLDLGKRNKLLNYKETKSSTLKITYPNYSDLYETFVKNENELVFPRDNSDWSSDDEQEELLSTIDDEQEYARDYGGYGSSLRTNRKPKDLQRVLRNLRNKAKVAVEEQGINILYLSFGFLKYTEVDHSKSTYLAPLVLVPVTLTVESITSPYVLKLHEDEIVVNPTLAYMLDSEYALKTPSFDSAGDISSFFDEVEDVVKDNGWTVVRNVGLSLLSFLKINMYVDLETHKGTISSNPVVRALAGDGTALTQIPEGVNDYDFDKNEKPQDVFQIVDADASQQEAILLAKKGVSFVLQGPPGTGKSQTITNIIAECLADGKKVLFVSEKMAALEVVHHRISMAGLDDFCLVLHSQKTSKRSVLDQLEKVLRLADKKATMSDSAFQKLNNLEYDKQQLNNYAEQVYAIVPPLVKSIYEVNGILANLESYDDIIFGLADVRGTDREKLTKYIQLLELYANTIGKMTDDFRSNPWRGSYLKAVTNEFRRDTTSKLSAYLPILDEKRKHVDEIYDTLFSVFIPSLNGIRKVVASLEGLENAVEIPYEWVSVDIIPLGDEIKGCVDQQTEINNIIDQVLQKAVVLSANGIIDPVSRQDLYDAEHVSDLEKTATKTIQYQEPFFRWTEDTYVDTLALFTEAKEKAERIITLKSTLSEQYEDNIYDVDYEGILSRYKTEYTNIFKVFKGSYKADKKAFIACHKELGHKTSDGEILKTIDNLKEIASLRKWFSEKEILLNEYFADTVTGESSDYDSVGLSLTLFSLLTQLDHYYTDLSEKLVAFNENESALKDHYQFLYNGIFTDWNSVSTAWKWAEEFREIILKHNPSQLFVKKVCASEKYANECVTLKEELSGIDSSIRTDIAWFTKLFDEPEVFNDHNLRELYDRLDGCMNGMALL